MAAAGGVLGGPPVTGGAVIAGITAIGGAAAGGTAGPVAAGVGDPDAGKVTGAAGPAAVGAPVDPWATCCPPILVAAPRTLDVAEIAPVPMRPVASAIPVPALAALTARLIPALVPVPLAAVCPVGEAAPGVPEGDPLAGDPAPDAGEPADVGAVLGFIIEASTEGLPPDPEPPELGEEAATDGVLAGEPVFPGPLLAVLGASCTVGSGTRASRLSWGRWPLSLFVAAASEIPARSAPFNDRW